MNHLLSSMKTPHDNLIWAARIGTPNYRLLSMDSLSEEELFNMLTSKYGNYLLHYSLSGVIGHCTALAVRGSVISFFDPIGEFVDDQYMFTMDPYKPRLLGNILAHLSERGYSVHYNHLKLQENKPGINTCSLWCLLFLKLASANPEASYRAVLNTVRPFHVAADSKYYDIALCKYLIKVYN
jgi:hypothetical protein